MRSPNDDQIFWSMNSDYTIQDHYMCGHTYTFQTDTPDWAARRVHCGYVEGDENTLTKHIMNLCPKCTLRTISKFKQFSNKLLVDPQDCADRRTWYNRVDVQIQCLTQDLANQYHKISLEKWDEIFQLWVVGVIKHSECRDSYTHWCRILGELGCESSVHTLGEGVEPPWGSEEPVERCWVWLDACFDRGFKMHGHELGDFVPHASSKFNRRNLVEYVTRRCRSYVHTRSHGLQRLGLWLYMDS